MNIEELRRNAQAAPHEVLQSASFVLAFGGEGAAAYVVHGGWPELLDRFARETIGHPAADMAMRTHPNHSEWMGWLESFHDLDEWVSDEWNLPYSFDSEVGEISTVSIYRLSEAGVPTDEDANNYCRILTLLGMEEEGDPVAAVRRLIAESDAAAERAAGMHAALAPFNELGTSRE